jgi:hypothetical protein
MTPEIIEVRDQNDNPLWLKDPLFASLRTDIACVEINLPNHRNIVCVNEAPDSPLLANVGFDCFVVGYPSSSYGPPQLPIWRKGSLAFEPMLPIDGKPIFLVDALTSPGMSGSAIYQRWHGPAPLMENGKLSVNLHAIVATRFVGVYGGRLGNKAEMGQIGYGWYANRIPIIISAAQKSGPP